MYMNDSVTRAEGGKDKVYINDSATKAEGGKYRVYSTSMNDTATRTEGGKDRVYNICELLCNTGVRRKGQNVCK